MQTVYLDYNATTPIDPEVVAAMGECFRAALANPASAHQPGRRARGVLEDARERIAELLGAQLGGRGGEQLVLTSGGTESNNLALFGLAGSPPGRIVVSALEHPSVRGPADELARRGFDVRVAPVDGRGVVDVDVFDALLTEDTRCASVMLGNHETGVLQPLVKLAERCRSRGIPLHTDAVQAVGKQAVNFRELGVSALTFTAHKFHGPRGIGGLLLAPRLTIQPLLFGGFQQGGLRPGTESVALTVGLRAALERWQEEAEHRGQQMVRLRDRLEAQLTAGDPLAVVVGAEAARLPHTTCIAFRGLDRQALAMALDLAGVACSTGSACASGSSEPSPVLRAMGLHEEVVEGALRLSLGAETTAAEVDLAVSRILRVVKELRGRVGARKKPSPSRQSSGKPL